MRGTRAGMHASITSKLGSVRNFTNMFDNVSKSTRDVESGNGDPRLKPYRYITLRSKPVSFHYILLSWRQIAAILPLNYWPQI